MIVYKRKSYDLLISHDPNELFDYYEVEELHGLKAKDCKAHINDETQAYIAGLSNFVPESNYKFYTDKRFIFINRMRCTDLIEATCLVFHECMHHSVWLFDYDFENKEEEIISWAEAETKEVIKLLKL
jgi:hypothetical protein